jgi:HSP20 family protein
MSNLVPASWRDSVEELRDRVSNIFDRWLPRRAEQVPSRRHEHWAGDLLSATAPNVDLAETDDEVLVYAELPGLDRSDFKVELDDRRILLRGNKKVSREEKKRNFHYSESAYGSFYRAIPLPCEVRSDQAKATYEKGVLKVRLPKTEEARARSTCVKVS